MNSKYIFLDIDGTLVDFSGKMPESAKLALQKAHKNGHKLIICTGRQLSQVYPWLLAENCFDGLILSGGAMVINDGKIIYHNCLETEKLCELLNYFDKRKTAYYLQTANALLSKQWCIDKTVSVFGSLGYNAEDLTSIFGPTVIEDDLASRKDIEKVIYYDSGIDISEVQNSIGDYFHIVGYSFGNLGNTSGEISENGVNKATGIHEYIKYCNADMKDTFAFGDGDNDTEMLDAVTTGIAMGNATENLKQFASYITDKINDDGLYNAFCRFNLI